MNHDKLAPVYLDNKPVTLKDAKPRISAILSEFGKTSTTQVKWLKSQSDTQGKSLSAEETIDRTAEPATPIYLTSSTKEQSGMNAGGRSGGAESSRGGGQQFQKRESGQGHDQTSETSRSGSVGSSSGESWDSSRQAQGGGKGQFEQGRGRGQSHGQGSESMESAGADSDSDSAEAYGVGRQNEPEPSSHGQGESRGARSDARQALGSVGADMQARNRSDQGQNRANFGRSNDPSSMKARQRGQDRSSVDADLNEDDDTTADSGQSEDKKY